jgi:hypothetical protein
MKLRFGLRTFFVLIAVAAIPMVWVAFQLNWIRQRHAFMNGPPKLVNSALHQDAPWPLGWFGERGILEISLKDPATAQLAHKLFPEAALWIVDLTCRTE